MPLNFRLQKRQNIYEQILRIPTNWPPDILSAMYAYYLFVFSILYLYFMGDCNRNMKFGYFKASPKLKKINILFLVKCHRVITTAPSKFQINVMVTSLTEGLLDIISHLCAIKLFSVFHNSPFL